MSRDSVITRVSIAWVLLLAVAWATPSAAEEPSSAAASTTLESGATSGSSADANDAQTAEEKAEAEQAAKDAEEDDEEEARVDELEKIRSDEETGIVPGTDYSDIEEFVVTGSAGQGIDTEAAASQVAFDTQELTELGAADIADIAKVTPNLEITQAGATQANFFIRGVGLADYSANSAGAVAIYQDGVPLNSSALQLTGFYDLESVAVLRGPQGSGSGRNASAGAIVMNSNKPTGEYQANMLTTFGTYVSDDAESAFIQQYEGGVEFPLVDEVLSTRLSFRVQDADPYMKNGCGNLPPYAVRPPRRGLNSTASLCGELVPQLPANSVSPIEPGLPTLVGDVGNWALRGVFRLQPTEYDMDWLLNVHGGQLDQQSSLGQAMGNPTGLQNQPLLGRQTAKGYIEPDQAEEFRALVASLGTANALTLLGQNLAQNRPLDIRPYRGDYNRVGQTTRNSWGASLNGQMFFDDAGFLGPITVESVTGIDGYDRFRDTDQDFTPDVLFESVQSDTAWQFFQELKTIGETSDGLFRWNVGGYFLMENLAYSGDFDTLSASFDFVREFRQETRSFAFYGGLEWDFLEDFTLEAGIRYNWERKSFDFEEVQGGTSVTIAAPQEDTWTAPTGLISLTYRFTDELSGYWKYSRGWKGGHFNANRANVPPAEPETLDSIEAGFHGSWFDSRLVLDGSIFYYKYKNYQVFLFENAVASPPILEVINANDAEQYGVELDLTVFPLQDWSGIPEILGDFRTTVRFGWLDSQFLDFVNIVEDIDRNTLQPTDREITYTGNALPNAPNYKVSLTLDWPFDFGRFGTIAPRYDLNWTDDIYFDPNEGRGYLNQFEMPNPAFTTGQQAYTIQNLRLSWRNEDATLEVAGWVRNLTDTRYKTFAFDATIFAAVVINYVAEPRTAGVDLTFSF